MCSYYIKFTNQCQALHQSLQRRLDINPSPCKQGEGLTMTAEGASHNYILL